jgi:hypothetical protein
MVTILWELGEGKKRGSRKRLRLTRLLWRGAGRGCMEDEEGEIRNAGRQEEEVGEEGRLEVGGCTARD